MYVIQTGKGWRAYTSHSIEVDVHYWYGDIADRLQEEDKLIGAGQGWLFTYTISFRQAQRIAYMWNRREETHVQKQLEKKASTSPTAMRHRFFKLVKQVCTENYDEQFSASKRKSQNDGDQVYDTHLKDGEYERWQKFREQHEDESLKFEQGSDLERSQALRYTAVAVRSVFALGEKTVCVDLQQYGAGKSWTTEQATQLLNKVLDTSHLLQGRSLLAEEVLDIFGVGADSVLKANTTKVVSDIAEGMAVVQLAFLIEKWQRSTALEMLEDLPRQPLSFFQRTLSLRYRCLRCGSMEYIRYSNCASCGESACAYCEQCLTMGRSRACTLLVQGGGNSNMRMYQFKRKVSQTVTVEKKMSMERLARLKKWGLSPAQTDAALSALQYIEEAQMEQSGQGNRARTGFQTNISDRFRYEFGRQNGAYSKYKNQCLLWAVTGAGKTEMVFPLVESVVLRGGKVLIATPRRDVVIELDPRLRRAFPDYRVTTLYGGSEQRWEQGEITIATTHQLLRFSASFDLVIIDELDAFPYVNDPMLHYAAAKAARKSAVRIFLSATPPRELQQAAKRGQLAHVRVPVRYHRHPLPVPQMIVTKSVSTMLVNRQLHPQLLQAIQRSWRRGAQLFVFLQRIEQTEPFAILLRQLLRKVGLGKEEFTIAATSSQDKERASKVDQFRKCTIRLLVTTTILERGVTIPRSDVYILDADGALFDEASLVQMAGRAGRLADDPEGKVYFCAEHYNEAQRKAIKQIRQMNRIAKRKGYLLSEKQQRSV
ncbi:helicase-related protein [Paenibacillus yanchengensis]|uniref:Helicase-related protein n=1 Tax=Paenibacillus yanchengensis TaxID=2035833 RepID=A0ABW4YMW5_9BACL